MRDRYWHNMAGRIQRAFRNYLRYKNECAKRIQRFWKNNKEAIVYAQRRDRGHEVLANRKERRRYSLLGYRRFMGDYLDIKGKTSLGEELASVCGIGCESQARGDISEIDQPSAEPVLFSDRAQLLVSKLGRSSKPMPRFLVVVRSSRTFSGEPS
jgi:myosin-1